MKMLETTNFFFTIYNGIFEIPNYIDLTLQIRKNTSQLMVPTIEHNTQRSCRIVVCDCERLIATEISQWPVTTALKVPRKMGKLTSQQFMNYYKTQDVNSKSPLQR